MTVKERLIIAKRQARQSHPEANEYTLDAIADATISGLVIQVGDTPNTIRAFSGEKPVTIMVSFDKHPETMLDAWYKAINTAHVPY